MNEILRPFQERTQNMDENNINQRCEVIEDNLNFLDEESQELKELQYKIEKLIEFSTDEIFKMFDDSYNEFNPEMMAKYKFLKAQIKDQKDENSNLLKQIDLLNQEITTIIHDIYNLDLRLMSLEKTVGLDAREVMNADSDEDDDDDDD